MATVIQIKRGLTDAQPTTANLAEGEMAYAQDRSNDGASGKLFIESIDSNGDAAIHTIGGKYYTDIVDDATNLGTASTLVKRDSNGDFAAGTISAALNGNANTASQWATARTITLQGDVSGTIVLDGSGDVDSSALEVTGAIANEVTGDIKAENGTVVLENGSDGTDATFTGDILSTGGQTVLDSGTDGSDATFTGDVTGDLTGDIFSQDGLVKILDNGTDGSNAAFIGNVTGNADTATDAAGLSSAVTVGLSGDATGSATFQDAGDTATIAMTLADSGVVAGQVGSTSEVPVLDIDSKGRVTSIGTAAITTSFVVGADSGDDDTVAGGETLTFAGTAGEIETAVTNNQIQIGLPDNVSVTGTMGVGGKLTVTGDLEVNGALTTVNSTDLEVTDGLIRLGKGNTADSLDLGFVSQFNDGVAKYSGFFRDTNDDKYHLFDTQEDLATAQTVDKGDASYTVSTLVANLESGAMQITNGGLTGGTISGLDTDLAVADGGTGASTFTTNGVLLGNGAGAIVATAAGTTEGHVLMSDASGVPSFQAIDGGQF